VLAELALRALPRSWSGESASENASPSWTPPGWEAGWRGSMRAHPILGLEHAAGVDLAVPLPSGGFRFRTNNLGLRRDEDITAAKPPGTVRILVLGDSHTDGYVDNDASFSTRLESRLRAAAPAPRVEVLNAGVVTYSPTQELLWFRTHGIGLQPDLVVLVFYPGNDAADMLGPGPRIDPETGAIVARSRPLAARLRTVSLLRRAAESGPVSRGLARLGMARAAEGHGYPADTLVEVFRTCEGCYWQTLFQAARARQAPPLLRTAVDEAAAVIAWLDREVRAHGARLLVVILPTRAQAEPERARADHLLEVADRLGLGRQDLAFEDDVARIVARRLADAGVGVTSLLEPMREASAEAALYHEADWHLNERGHRVVAAALEREISARGLLRAETGDHSPVGTNTFTRPSDQASR